MEKITYNISGMSCQHCVGSVKNALAKVPGITNVQVSLEQNIVVLEGDNIPTKDDLNHVLEDYGNYQLV